MTRSRSARLVVIALAVALLGLVVIAWEPLYWWVMTERRYHETLKPSGRMMRSMGWSQTHRGWHHVARWGNRAGRRYGPFVYYYPQTGTKYKQGCFFRNGRTEYTKWWIDGTVAEQRYDRTMRTSSPWRWGVKDQRQKSMPDWMGDDEQWRATLLGE